MKLSFMFKDGKLAMGNEEYSLGDIHRLLDALNNNYELHLNHNKFKRNASDIDSMIIKFTGE